MHPKVVLQKQLDAAKATVEGLAETRQVLAVLAADIAGLVVIVGELERKIEALGRMLKGK